jgi:hypothetical protein
VEFKSTRAGYAVDRAFDPGKAAASHSVCTWLGPDLDRMSAEGGVFVLLMCTPEVPVVGEFKDYDLSGLRSMGLRRYHDWLASYATDLLPGALVEHCDAGQGVYGGLVIAHDALIVHWA